MTDPDHLAHALDRYLDARFLAGEAMKIDRRKAARWPLASGDGDTIWMGAADTSGLVVSYIQSLYWEFGSGCVLPRNRRADAEPRRELFAAKPARSIRWRPAGCRSTRSIQRSPCSRTDELWPMAAWAATASRRRKVRCSRATLVSANHSLKRSTGRAGCSAAPGAPRVPRCASKPRFDGNLIDGFASAGHEVEVLPDDLFRRHGPRRRRGAAPGRHLRRRPRSAGGRRRGGDIELSRDSNERRKFRISHRRRRLLAFPPNRKRFARYLTPTRYKL